ncbi:MAG: HEAT repeat domain-containing protein [bacterium]
MTSTKKNHAPEQWLSEKKALKSKKAAEMIYAANLLLVQRRHPELKDVVIKYRSKILVVALKKNAPIQVRIDAFKALSSLGLENPRKDLDPIFTGKEEAQIIIEAAQLVQKQTGKLVLAPKGVALLIKQFKADGDWLPQCNAIIALRYFEDSCVIPILVEALKHKEQAVRREALYGLGEQKAVDRIPVIKEIMLKQHDQEIVAGSIALEQIGTSSAIKILSDEKLYKKALGEANDHIYGRFTVSALAQFHLKRVDDDLIKLAKSEDAEVAEKARDGLIKRRCERAILELAPFYLKSSWTFSSLLNLIVKINAQLDKFDDKIAKRLAIVFEKIPKKNLEVGLEGSTQARYRYADLSDVGRDRFVRFAQTVIAEIKNPKIQQIVAELFGESGERSK